LAIDAGKLSHASFTQDRSRYRQLLPLLLVFLAFVLRVYHLDFQSLWSDEGISLLRSSQPLGQMLRLMPVEHVPGYFVLLNFWLPRAGTSDFALRLPSLIPSVLVVALAYRMGADLGSRRAGLAAALLLSTGAFQIWYGQEARMYSWLLATACGSTWFLWRTLQVQRLRLQVNGPNYSGQDRPPQPSTINIQPFNLIPWSGYVLCTAATLYLHHYGFLLPMAQTVFALVWLATTRDWRKFLAWVAAGVAVVLLYLPWVPRFLGIFGFPGWRQALDPRALPWRYLAAYTVGDPMPAPWHDWLPWLYLVLALLGLWTWWRQSRMAAFLLFCVTAVPFAGAIALAIRQPDYHERYTIFISAPLVLFVARGLWPFRTGSHETVGRHPLRTALRNTLPALLLALLVAANSLALYRLYTDPSVQKADYKSAVRRIEQNEQPGDVILLDGPEPQQIFLHYYHGQTPWFDMRPLMKSSEADAAATMTETINGAGRAWVLRHYHDEGPVQAWLAHNAWPTGQSYYGGLYFDLYGLPALQSVAQPAGQAFGPALTLKRLDLVGGEPAGDSTTVRAGDLLGVTTEWQVLEAPPPLKFSLRLQDGRGQRWAAEDYVPQAGFAPSETWQPGQTVTDRHALVLPPDLPPGRYHVALVLYDPTTGRPLNTGQPSALAEVNVAPPARLPDPATLPIPVHLDHASIGQDLALLGYGITPQPLRAGQSGTLTLWWQAKVAGTGSRTDLGLGAESHPDQLLVELSDGHGQLAARKLYPPASVPAGGQVVRANYPLELNPAAPSGTYHLNLTLAGPDGQARGPTLNPGSVKFEARPRTYRLPHLSNAVDARLGENIILRGFDLNLPKAAPAEVGLTLVWQATAPVTTSYKVFVHLLDDRGQIVAQSDAVPAAVGGALAPGGAPTESWLANEVVVDQHVLAAPGPGRYHLQAGLYDPATGQRPPARDRAGQPLADDAVSLPEFQVP
jgi:mannosyltransferase